MNGFQITFFTQQDRRHDGKPVCEWLMQLAKELGLSGATLMPAAEGFGQSGRMHSAHFFELSDQPQAVFMTATAAQADGLFAHIRAAAVEVFYVKTPVEFGILGAESH